MENEEIKQEECIDYEGKAARFTLALLLATLLIWAIYDKYKTGNNGFQWALVSATTLVYFNSKRYLIRRDSKRKRKEKEG